MPEMPEVETIRRSLVPYVEGKRIESLDLRLERLVKYPTAAEFTSRLAGRTIEKLSRRGKYLLFNLDNADIFVVHLRMTGQLIYKDDGKDWPYTRLVLNLSGGGALLFADLRTLGALYLIAPQETEKIKGLHSLGAEALSEEFTAKYLAACCKKKKAKIKSFLLDQSQVAGLGNIYADEALFLAGIHPRRQADSLKEREIAALYRAINRVIADGIKDGGTTFSDYLDADGKSGRHQENLNVYQRTKKPCKKCATPIQRISIGGRSAHFCPKCQKESDL